jgi:hypothetical protein
MSVRALPQVPAGGEMKHGTTAAVPISSFAHYLIGVCRLTPVAPINPNSPNHRVVAKITVTKAQPIAMAALAADTEGSHRASRDRSFFRFRATATHGEDCDGSGSVSRDLLYCHLGVHFNRP